MNEREKQLSDDIEIYQKRKISHLEEKYQIKGKEKTKRDTYKSISWIDSPDNKKNIILKYQFRLRAQLIPSSRRAEGI